MFQSFTCACTGPSIAPIDPPTMTPAPSEHSSRNQDPPGSVSFELDGIQQKHNWDDDIEIQNKLQMRLSEIDNNRSEGKQHDAQDEVLEATVKALGSRAFHLPQNKTWGEDWRQYLSNNHPLLGVCCSSRISPIGFGEKIVGMVISLLIAVTLTNFALLWELLDDSLFSFQVSNDSDPVNISLALILLWTVISALHAVHDILVWYVWCTQIKLGYIFWLLLWTGAGIMMSALVSDQAGDDYSPARVLIYTGIEVAFSWFFWYPIFATILFSGVLGCRRFSVLGGRPRQVRQRGLEVEKRKSGVPMNTMAALADYDASTMASKSVFQ